MFELRNKVILTDVDGVLLDWTYSFVRHMDERYGIRPVRFDTYDMAAAFDVEPIPMVNMISGFNESIHIGNLTPLGDAIKYVRKLHEEHGFVFHAITAIGVDADTQRSRLQNLQKIFGMTAFEHVICVARDASKRHILEKYMDSGCLWIEDHFGNAVDGSELGLTALLMDSFHNQHKTHPDVQRVSSWREIYDIAVQG